MLVQYPYALRYLTTALEASPVVIQTLLEGITDEEADFRPDPDRFTIREAIAHLADWEPIWLERMQRICNEDHPTLEGYDEGEFAIQNNYAGSVLAEQLELFSVRRLAIVSFLKTRHQDEWQRTADRPEIGVITLEALAFLLPIHDAYHEKQIAEYRSAWKNR